MKDSGVPNVPMQTGSIYQLAIYVLLAVLKLPVIRDDQLRSSADRAHSQPRSTNRAKRQFRRF